MKPGSKKRGIWVAVLVWRGFVEEVHAFDDEKAARRREAYWRARMNPDYDETAAVQVHVKRTRSLRAGRSARKQL